jgi:ketosteroid isomerase-like protein
MKHIVFAVGLVVLAFGIAILAQTQTESVEQELLKLEQDWTNANVKADFAFPDLILADDYVNTDFEGVVKTKGQYLEALKLDKELVISSMVTDDMKVHVYGEAAVVTGRNTVNGTYKGTDFSVQYRWTDTWVKKAGRWQCVATAESRIAQK